MSARTLRAKGARFLQRARASTDPGQRRELLRTAELTLRAARKASAAEYAVAVGRKDVSLAGYRAWVRASAV